MTRLWLTLPHLQMWQMKQFTLLKLQVQRYPKLQSMKRAGFVKYFNSFVPNPRKWIFNERFLSHCFQILKSIKYYKILKQNSIHNKSNLLRLVTAPLAYMAVSFWAWAEPAVAKHSKLTWVCLEPSQAEQFRVKLFVFNKPVT